MNAHPNPTPSAPRRLRPTGLLPSLAVLGLLAAWARPAAAQVTAIAPLPPASQPAGPKVIQMAIHPAAEPRPALRYLLLPPLIDQAVGNAAVLYEQAAGLVSRTTEQDRKRIDTLLDTPLADLDLAAARALASENALRLLTVAARQDRCTWDVPFRDQHIHVLVPNLGAYRTLARMQLLLARCAIRERRHAEAIRALQNVFALARDISRQPLLISGLVGVAIASQALDVVRELQQQPDAPNLYWALASLPRPLIDLRPALEVEHSLVQWMVPELRGLDPEKITVDQGQQVTARWLALADLPPVPGGAAKAPTRKPLPIASANQLLGDSTVATVVQAMALYPAAKRYMLAQGKTPAEVDAMPPQQVLAAYQIGAYLEVRDHVYKCFALPYPQALAAYRQAERVLLEAQARGEGLPYIVLLPALNRVTLRCGQLDRQVAMQQTVEALRLYAAGHNGELPATLADLAVAPAPSDPLTGQPFTYERRGHQAVLCAPAPPNYDANTAVQIEIALEGPRADR